MSWKPEVDELERRRELARRMGGPERIARQHGQGKLTVRERIDALADKGSFREFMGLVGHGIYDNGTLVDFRPKPSVEGVCTLDGRNVIVTGGDFTTRGGSAHGSGGLGMELPANRRALEWRIPYVRLLDAAGGSVRSFEEIGRTYLPDGNVWSAVDARLLRVVPVVSAVMGSVAGLPAVNACLAHFNLMVKGTSQLFPGGPPVVKAALGYDITKVSDPARPATGVRCAPDRREGRRPGVVLRDRAVLGSGADHGAGAARRLPRGGDGEQPAVRRIDRCPCRREGDAADPAL